MNYINGMDKGTTGLKGEQDFIQPKSHPFIIPLKNLTNNVNFL